MRPWLSILLAILFLGAAAGSIYYFYAHPQTEPAAVAEDATVRATVMDFGTRLNSVSLLAPDASAEIANAYGSFATPELLASWQADPSRAPGRLTSSPWPSSITVASTTRMVDGTYHVIGAIQMKTSTGDAGSIPVSLTLVAEGSAWKISAYAAEMPSAPAVPSITTVSAGINQGASALGIILLPESITEDSRCPEDVQCIQAGTVKVKTRVQRGTASSTEMTFGLNAPVKVGTTTITLTDVAPAKNSKVTLKPADYHFTFRIEESAP